MNFQYSMKVNVIFGADSLERLADLAVDPVLIVTTEILSQLGLTDKVATVCHSTPAVYDQVEANPTVQTVLNIAQIIRRDQIKTVIALGGGSSMDAAKAASSLAVNDTDIRDCLYHGKPVPARQNCLILIPTTAGTGSEVTNVAVLSDPENHRKTPLVSHSMWADYAVIVPELTATMPKSVTASTGFDALIHAIEAYWATSTQPISEALGMEAARIICDNIERAYDDGSDLTARENMVLGSLLAGIAFSQTRTTVLHAASFPLTNDYHVDHGRACAVNMLPVMRYLLGYIPDKLNRLAVYCGFADAAVMIDELERRMLHCGMPVCLQDVGVVEEDIPRLAKVTMSAPIARLTPAPMDEAIVENLFKQNFRKRGENAC